MENRIYFRLGGKSFDITETIMISDTWFEWVENSRYYTRRMSLSKGAMVWLCRRLREASEVRGKMFKTWRGRDVSTNIFCSLKFNKFGRFLSIITVNGQMRSVIIIPENKDNEGWLGLVSRIESFINRRSLMQAGTPAVGEINHPSKRGEGSYKDALYKNRWMVQEPTISKVQGTVTASSHHDGNDLLQRCLVGSFPDFNEMPTRNDVRRWIQQTWRGVYNIQVFDMNGIQFLFEFQSRKDAQHILLGNWKRQGKQLVLDWWSPTSGAYPAHTTFQWFWIRVLGLPLQLWSENIMKEIGDQCGGWLATEEETTIKKPSAMGSNQSERPY
uniref:Putative ovule protein n=1 Tax=Solanum chacoense TaxID=4108 RepID=A0A0V0IKX8_SOLCH